jgi:hypothetical protein
LRVTIKHSPGCGCCGCAEIIYADLGDEVDQFEAADSGDPPSEFSEYENTPQNMTAIKLTGVIAPKRTVRREAYLIQFKLYGKVTVEVEGYKCTIDTINGTVDMDDPSDVAVLNPGKPLPTTTHSDTDTELDCNVNIFVCPTHIYVYGECLFREGGDIPGGAGFGVVNTPFYCSAMIVAEPSSGEFDPSGDWTIEGFSDALINEIKVNSFEVKFGPASGSYSGEYGYGYDDAPRLDCRQTRNYNCDFESRVEIKTFRSLSLPSYIGSVDMSYTGEVGPYPNAISTGQYVPLDDAAKYWGDSGFDPTTKESVLKTAISDPFYTEQLGTMSIGTGACNVAGGIGAWVEDPSDSTKAQFFGAGASVTGSITYDFPEPTRYAPYPLPRFKITVSANGIFNSSKNGRYSDGMGGYYFSSVSHAYQSTSFGYGYTTINGLRSGFTVSASGTTADTYTVTDPDSLLTDPTTEWAVGFSYPPGEPPPYIMANAAAAGSWTLF